MTGSQTKKPEPWDSVEYGEGRQAYKENEPETANPYPGDWQRRYWFHGWYEAKDQEKFGCPVGAEAAKEVMA